MLWAASALALALVLPPTTPVDHVHSSSRYDRSPASLARAAHLYTSRPGVDLITWTEVDAERRARVLDRLPGWRSYTPAGTDVAVSWKRSTWRPVVGARGKLAPDAYPFLVTVLDRRSDGMRMLVVVAHLPSGVELGDGWRDARRAATWRRAVSSLAHAVPRLRQRWRPALVIVAADWNVDLHRPVWRHRVRDPLAPLRLTWRRDRLPSGGTFAGGRLIDGTLTNGRGHALLMPDDRSSDHRPYRERVYTPRRES